MIKSLSWLKSVFETDDKPSQEQFSNLVDSVGEKDYNIIIPLYKSDVDLVRATYETIIDAKISCPNVGFTVIINPTAGLPLSEVGANHTLMISRLQGVGCRVIGYVTTFYGGNYFPDFRATSTWIDNVAYHKDGVDQLCRDNVDLWYGYYPTLDGIFFDEMWNGFSGSDFKADLTTEITFYKSITDHVRDNYNSSMIMGNCGTDVSHKYWDEDICDVFVLQEASTIPTIALLSGQSYASSGHEFVDRRRKAAIVHTQSKLNMEGMYRAFKYCGYYYSTPESDGLWSYVGDQLLDIARILSVGFLDTLVIGYGTDQISPQTLEPKFSVIGFSDINGRNSYTYGNYRLVDGLHVNVFRDTSDNYQRKIDFIAVGDQDGSAGGAEFRFFCNNETSDTAKPAMILTNKKIKVVGLSYEDTQITTGTSGVTTDLFRFLDINGSVLTGVKCGTMWITCVNSGGETTTVYFVFMKDALHDYSMNSMASASMGGINVVADGSGHKIQTTMPATSGTNTYVTKFSGIVYR